MVHLVVLGLGPAGAAAAIAARAAGLEVTLLGREHTPRPRPGETLPPHAGTVLSCLGIGDLIPDGHLPSHGTCAAWADPTPVENDFLFSPFGPGWHLDRVAFDARVLRRAIDTGARLVAGTRLCSAHWNGEGWRIVADRAGERVEVCGNFVIDATGRSAWLARSLGNTRVAVDRLVGVIGFLDGVTGSDTRTFLDATEDGWWYAARLPGGRGVAAFMTDADIASRYPGGPAALWGDRLPRAQLAAAITGPRPQLSTLRVVPAGGARLARVVGPSWAAVGDAAASWDPLSSRGITTALETGIRATAAAVAALGGDTAPLADYANWVEATWTDYLGQHRDYYRQVRRWPDSSFWRRRQS